MFNSCFLAIHVFGVSSAMTVKWGISKENLSPSIFCSPLITKENAYCISKTPLVYVLWITQLTSYFIHYKRNGLRLRVYLSEFRKLYSFPFFRRFSKKQERFENFSIVKRRKFAPLTKWRTKPRKHVFLNVGVWVSEWLFGCVWVSLCETWIKFSCRPHLIHFNGKHLHNP